MTSLFGGSVTVLGVKTGADVDIPELPPTGGGAGTTIQTQASSRSVVSKGTKAPFYNSKSFRWLFLIALFVTFMPVVRIYGNGVGNPAAATTPILVMFKYAYGNFQTGCNTQTDTGCTVTWPGVSQAAQANTTAMIWVSLFIVMGYELYFILQVLHSQKTFAEFRHWQRDIPFTVAVVLVLAPALYFVGYVTINDVLLLTVTTHLWNTQPHRALLALEEAMSHKDDAVFRRVLWDKFIPEFFVGFAYDFLLWLPAVVSANMSSFSSSVVPLQQAIYAMAAFGVLGGTTVSCLAYPMVKNVAGKSYAVHELMHFFHELDLILLIWTGAGLYAQALFYNRLASY